MKSQTTTPILLAYLPVYHAGVAQFFQDFPNSKKLILIPGNLLRDFGPTHKDLHALPPEIIKMFLETLDRFEEITVADEKILRDLDKKSVLIMMPDESALHMLAEKYFPSASVNYHNIFLRWDNKKALEKKTVEADAKISEADFDHRMIELAKEEGEKSADWWRRVGAILFDEQNRTIIAQAHNTHLPSDHTPCIDGDIRAQFHKGEHFELTTAIHAEALLIATAAKNGIATAGHSLYLTDFPCPVCAKLIAASGIKKLYFKTGYAMIDGESVLKNFGVEIIQVK